MANLTPIAEATLVDDQTMSFNISNVSNLLVAIFVASSTSQDTTEPDAQIQDSLNNNWNLIQWSAEAGNQPAIAVYVAPPIPALKSGVATLQMPAEMVPGDSVSTAVNGFLFSSKLGVVAADSFAIEIATVTPSPDYNTVGSVVVTQTGTDDLIIAGLWSSLASGAYSVGHIPGAPFNGTTRFGLATDNLVANGFFLSTGWAETTSGPTTYQESFYVNPEADVPNFTYAFAVSMSLSGGIAGGSGNSTRAFFLSRAPEPKISVPSRFIATIQIDCTQMIFNPFATTPCQFPEFSFPLGGVGEQLTYGWSVLEFDLEHIGNSGGGLDQVRKLIAHSRPTFGYSPDNQPGGFPQDGGIGGSGGTYALLTNTTTLQTEVLGGGAIQAAAQCADPNEAGYYFEKLHCSFPGHKGGMKYRFLALSDSSQGAGLYTLNFLNYDDGQGSLQYTGLLYGTSD